VETHTTTAVTSRQDRASGQTSTAVDDTGEHLMPSQKEVIERLKEIQDPHTNVSVYDMGLISELKVTKDSVSLVFRPTSPFCPLGMHLATNIKRRLMDIKGTKKVKVTVVGHVQESIINETLCNVQA
jgi:metal-sulfur cluster biosynthetic enzyme